MRFALILTAVIAAFQQRWPAPVPADKFPVFPDIEEGKRMCGMPLPPKYQNYPDGRIFYEDEHGRLDWCFPPAIKFSREFQRLQRKQQDDLYCQNNPTDRECKK
jgi:hypothetical protein